MQRTAPDRVAVTVAEGLLRTLRGHWLLVTNALLGLSLAGVLLAPLLLAAGLEGPGRLVYDTYHAACHQWAFRSFFVLGAHATYSRAALEAMGFDPFALTGNAELGWKVAFCERNLAILVGLLLFGLLYGARWRAGGLKPASFVLYAVLIAPMAIDGLTQLVGWRESTWELRVATGSLFGLASAWLLYPRFDPGPGLAAPAPQRSS